jgi:hypothetical protein
MKTTVVYNVFSLGSKNMTIVNCKFNSTDQDQKNYFVVLTLCKQLKIKLAARTFGGIENNRGIQCGLPIAVKCKKFPHKIGSSYFLGLSTSLLTIQQLQK